jgi:hypothetical protein
MSGLKITLAEAKDCRPDIIVHRSVIRPDKEFTYELPKAGDLEYSLKNIMINHINDILDEAKIKIEKILNEKN